MKKKSASIISGIIIGTFVVIFFVNPNSVDKDLLSETFVVDAVYFENEGYVEITFNDKSQKTKTTTLEILGLPESFQKIFNESQFVERIPFSTVPKYGWKSHPLTLVIDHDDLGKIGIKTEIHPHGTSPPEIIYSHP